MKTRNELTGKLLAIIEEAEGHGVDVAIYLAHIMKRQAAQIEIKNTRMPVDKPVAQLTH